MSSIADTRKAFRFAVDINGINQLSVQKITGLSAEVEAVAHGESDHDIFTAGRTKYTDVVMESIMPTDVPENTLWNLLQKARVAISGSTKQTVTVRMLDADGITTLETWALRGAWITKVEIGELNRTSSDNLMRTATWKVDEIVIL